MPTKKEIKAKYTTSIYALQSKLKATRVIVDKKCWDKFQPLHLAYEAKCLELTAAYKLDLAPLESELEALSFALISERDTELAPIKKAYRAELSQLNAAYKAALAESNKNPKG